MASSAKAHARGELKRLDRREPALEQQCAEIAVAFILRSAERRARRPQSARAWLSSEPSRSSHCALMTHEIAEATSFLIESVPQKREVDARQTLELLLRDLTRRFLQQQGEDEGARVVVRAVAFVEIRHVEDRVLKNAGVIAHPKQVIELQRRQLDRVDCPACAPRTPSAEDRSNSPGRVRSFPCSAVPRPARSSRVPVSTLFCASPS